MKPATLGALVILVLCGGLTLLAFLVPRQPKTARVAVTAFAPKVVLAAAATQVQDPPTASPTSVPTMAPTPTASEADLELAYRGQVKQYRADMQTAVGDLQLQIGYATNDISLIKSERWKADFKTALDQMRDVNARIRLIQPPTRYAKAHGRWLEGADFFDKAIDALRTEAGDLNFDRIKEAGGNVANAGLAFERAGEEMKEAGE